MIAKEHKSKSGIVLSICDENIIGEKFSEGGLVLDLTSDFYKGDKISEKDTKERCLKAYIINAVGKESVNLIKEMGFVKDKNIINIKNIPFAQCLVIENEL